MVAQGRTGFRGAVRANGVLVAKLRRWRWTRETNLTDAAGFGDEYDDPEPGRKRGTGSAEGLWASGAAGQDDIETFFSTAEQITLDLQMTSDAGGANAKVNTIPARVSQIELGAEYEGATTFNFNFSQIGAPTAIASHA